MRKNAPPLPWSLPTLSWSSPSLLPRRSGGPFASCCKHLAKHGAFGHQPCAGLPGGMCRPLPTYDVGVWPICVAQCEIQRKMGS